MNDELLIEWLTSEYDARQLAERILALAEQVQLGRMELEAEYFQWRRRHARRD